MLEIYILVEQAKHQLTIKLYEILKKKIFYSFIKKNYINQKDEQKILKNKGKIISEK